MTARVSQRQAEEQAEFEAALGAAWGPGAINAADDNAVHLAAALEMQGSLSREVDRLHKAVAQARAAADERVSGLAHRLAEAVESLQTTQAELEAAQATIKCKTDLLAERRDEIAALTKQIVGLQAQGASLRQRLAQRSTPAVARDQHKALKETVKQERLKAEEAQARAERAEARADRLARQLETEAALDAAPLIRLLTTGPRSMRAATLKAAEDFARSFAPIPSAARLLATAASREPEGSGKLTLIRAVGALLGPL